MIRSNCVPLRFFEAARTNGVNRGYRLRSHCPESLVQVCANFLRAALRQRPLCPRSCPSLSQEDTQAQLDRAALRATSEWTDKTNVRRIAEQVRVDYRLSCFSRVSTADASNFDVIRIRVAESISRSGGNVTGRISERWKFLFRAPLLNLAQGDCVDRDRIPARKNVAW